ncbi:NTP transferase domain-containing protein [Clostridium aminobutyricum]|uniref:NTP transferase domain-containing protein n=1 Tax=Clostridium aminobutyricum TaxID=33953 RepID=A0A939D9U1_CLOAM|nr:NTP transferase domain-containing protein [Clostridium aminobutyricum]MBN7773750.1 NTP transferase domain-containing protein [Clostridium aminobutyricum]
MKALILNSGRGSRMGELTYEHPKCMTEISDTETILSRQLKQLYTLGINDIVITTGYKAERLIDYVKGLNLKQDYNFVHNDRYENTNYIYSIYLAKEQLGDEILFMHGDLVFDFEVIQNLIEQERSCMAISSTLPLPDKDFKAVVFDNKIEKIGIEFFEHALAAQPLYLLKEADWLKWLNKMEEFCRNGEDNCYAEKAFNAISKELNLFPYDVEDRLCKEIDNERDLITIKKLLR